VKQVGVRGRHRETRLVCDIPNGCALTVAVLNDERAS
jgi:hypothetical protein